MCRGRAAAAHGGFHGRGPTGVGPRSRDGEIGDTCDGAGPLKSDLPKLVDVSAFVVDPGAGCGDPDDASTAGYRIEVSTNGSTYTTVPTAYERG